MANKITLTFAGDADSLAKAAKKSEQSLGGVDAAADKSGKQLSNASKSSADLGTKMGHLGSAVSGAGDAIDAVGGSLTAINDLQQAGANRAARLARSLLDVQQAQEDFNQALRDGRQAEIDSGQAQIDLEQANLDAAVALKDYNTAVKEHGANSVEAKQASIDLKQANQDVAQANEDSAQAARDASQATIDAKTAQLDLNDANKEARPPELQKWAENLQLVTPLLSAVVGVVGLVTAAQWLWNASLFANPITWIIVGIVALVAIIVLIATKTTWFQDLWGWAWGGIKAAALFVWDWITGTLWPGIKAVWDDLVNKTMWVKDMFVSAFKATVAFIWDAIGFIVSIPERVRSAFLSITSAITAPFRAAFNYVSDAWNNTIGRLHWTVPGWVPGVGGNSISAPTLPKFHTGGIVPGGMGSETLAVLQAGERVTPAGGGSGHSETILLGSDGSDFGDFLVSEIRKAINRRGGDPGRVLGNRRG